MTMKRPYTTEELLDGPNDQYELMVKLKPTNFHLTMPRYSPLLFAICEVRVDFIVFFQSHFNYFTIRHRMSVDAKRSSDLVFLLHYIHDHLAEKKHGKITEMARFYWLYKVIYDREWTDWNNLKNKTRKSKNEKKFLEIYDYLHFEAYIIFQDTDRLDYFHGPTS